MDPEIYEKTWAGEIFGPNGSLEKVQAEAQKKRSGGDPVSGEVPLVSQYYTAAKQCIAHWRERRWNMLLLLWATWYGLKALDRARWLCHYHFNKLDHGQLDVLGAVFFRAHAFGHAQHCYETAFSLLQRRRQQGKPVAPHEEALVLCGYAHVRELLGGRFDLTAADELYKEALRFGLDAACDRKQQVRILRTVAEYFMRHGEARAAVELLLSAKYGAAQEKMSDQLLQVEQALRRAKKLLPDR